MQRAYLQFIVVILYTDKVLIFKNIFLGGKTVHGFSFLFLGQKCERLLLYLYCHELSIEFQEPVPASVSCLPQYFLGE